MEKRELLRKSLAALFFVTGIFLTVLFLLSIGRDKGITEPKFKVTVVFRNVGGLMEGAPVRLLGVNVGTIDSIGFLENEIIGRRVIVTLKIFTKYKKQLKQSTRFAIKTEGILGEKLMEIYEIENEQKINISQPIIGQDPLDIQDLATVFSRAAETFTKTAEEMSQIDMVELAEVMRDSSMALLTTSEGINDIMEEIQAIAKKSKRLFDRIEQKVIDGDLFKVF